MKYIYLLILLIAFPSIYAQFGNKKEWSAKVRIDYFHSSEYKSEMKGGGFWSGNTYNVGGPTIQAKGMGRGSGVDMQFSLQKTSNIMDSRVDLFGFGIVANVKLENIETDSYLRGYPYDNFNNINTAKARYFDIGLSTYLTIYEAHVGYGYAFFDSPFIASGGGVGDLFADNPTGGYFFLRQYINIPIYAGFSLTGGLTVNVLSNDYLFSRSGELENWRNYYFSYGVVYKFPVGKQSKKRNKNEE